MLKKERTRACGYTGSKRAQVIKGQELSAKFSPKYYWLGATLPLASLQLRGFIMISSLKKLNVIQPKVKVTLLADLSSVKAQITIESQDLIRLIKPRELMSKRVQLQLELRFITREVECLPLNRVDDGSTLSSYFGKAIKWMKSTTGILKLIKPLQRIDKASLLNGISAT